MPKVSVIIPTYNCASFINEAIESIINQSYQDLEVIVIDDGSNDDTDKVLKPYMNRIKYIYQENKGVAIARNVGIRAAKGEYIAFLDSDDIWYPEKLKIQTEILDSHQNVGLVYSDVNIFGGKVKTSVLKDKNKAILSGKIFDSLLLGKFYICCSSVIFRKSYIEKVGLFDESLKTCEDLDMWLRITRECDAIFIDNPLVQYRSHSANITKNMQQMYADKYYVLNKIFSNLLLSKRIQALKPQVWGNFHFEFGKSYYFSKDFQKSNMELTKAIKLVPFSSGAYLCLFKSFLREVGGF